MKTFNVLKKNRKYFAAELNGYKCKILIDKNSENLGLGTKNLEVEDISVRSKYGTDLIFKLSASVEEIAESGITTLKHPLFNSSLLDDCRRLQGQWDSDKKTWVFSSLVEDRVEELDHYYNANMSNVEITFKKTMTAYCEAVQLMGYPIAKAWGRDSGAKVCDGVYLLSGSVKSGGSIKNWCTVVEEGVVIRMSLSQAIVNDLKEMSDIQVREL